MKKIFLLLWVGLASCLSGCQDVTVGYLTAENAKYIPDTMEIRLVLDEELDAFRIYNVAPWVSPRMQGMTGTEPMSFEISEVKTTEGGNADLFKHLLTIRGGGRMSFPLVSDITPGKYTVSVKISNEGYTKEVKDVFTFIVK